jgi:hypothetical protein
VEAREIGGVGSLGMRARKVELVSPPTFYLCKV